MRLKSWMKASWSSLRKMLEMQESASFNSHNSRCSEPFLFCNIKITCWLNLVTSINSQIPHNTSSLYIVSCNSIVTRISVCVRLCVCCWFTGLKMRLPLFVRLLPWRKSWSNTEVLCSSSTELLSIALHHSVKHSCLFSSDNQIMWYTLSSSCSGKHWGN